MKAGKLAFLAVVTLAVILAAGIMARLQAPRVSVARAHLFPDLAGQINAIDTIAVRSNMQTVSLRRQGDGWVIASADDYPALFNKVKQTVIGLSELRILAEKTDNPDRYSRLGVEGIEVKDSDSLLVTLTGDAGMKVAELIVGRPRQSSGSRPGLYVRPPDLPRALLVEGHLDISDETRDWFERNIFDISPSRVQQVTITRRPGSELTIYKDTREQPDFRLKDDPKEASSAARIIYNRIATGLEEMRADNVMSREKFEFDDEAVTTTFTTFDGLVITARSGKRNGKTYAHFAFAHDPAAAVPEAESAGTAAETAGPDPREEAAELGRRLSGWVYEIPDFKYDTLTMKRADLIKPPPGEGDPATATDSGE